MDYVPSISIRQGGGTGLLDQQDSALCLIFHEMPQTSHKDPLKKYSPFSQPEP